MTGLVWELEWRIAVVRRRLFALNVFVPLLLVTPIALAGAPAVHASAAYAVLFTLYGTFGSAIPLVRDGETGLLGRVLRAGVRPHSYLLQRTAAGTSIDVLQLAPCLAVAGWGAGASWPSLLTAGASLALGLWIANLLGVAVAAFARSVAEAALFSAVSALLLLHVSGVFRTPQPGSFGAALEAAAPFRALHESLLAMAGAGDPRGGMTLAVWAVALPSALVLVAERLGRVLLSARRS